MVPGREVRPGKWSDVLDLYDDGVYSVIWGRYKKNSYRVLGVRWNGKEGEVGYPNLGGNPLWYVEPDFLLRPVLLGIREKVERSPNLPNREQYLKNIAVALDEAPTREEVTHR
jgi:hypothetical protein